MPIEKLRGVMMPHMYVVAALLLLPLERVHSFTTIGQQRCISFLSKSSSPSSPSRASRASAKKYTSLYERNGDNEFRKDVNSMRRILEESWKEETMGSVPTTPERAAKNAAESVLSALESDSGGSGGSDIFMVDISLPSLDPMSGHNVYDDVGAAEFCIEFAQRINENRKSCGRIKDGGGVSIVVRDDNLIQRVERFVGKTSTGSGGSDGSSSSSSKEEDEEKEFYDDFADFSGGSSFQLEDAASVDDGNGDDETVQVLPDNVRLVSILGNNEIEAGKDMINDVVRSVATNAKPTTNDDVIVILAPISQQELVGVRWLVSKYGESKTIIIFNNKLHPLPNELMFAETCYSVFPLIARSSSSSPSPDDESRQQQSKNPKIVLLRRFPRDWEIHIDTNEGSGFELAGSVPAVDVGMRGPSMEWIAGCVKQHMQLKFGK